ncbi:MAG: leucine-rich repeat protein, partial [Spirochaetaceae bacterium]|nr:leucine-rich repeat protein [Spirochaetaceae bacterium]
KIEMTNRCRGRWRPYAEKSASAKNPVLFFLKYLLAAMLFAGCPLGRDIYSVSYYGNDADVGSAPVDAPAHSEGLTAYTTGQSVTVLGNSGGLAKTGYEFAGWNTEPDGSGEPHDPAQTFPMGSSDVSLYAMWHNGLAYTLDSGGGAYSVKAGSAKTGDVIIPAYWRGEPVASIGAYAFQNCVGLASISIPSSVATIGNNAFLNCDGLSRIRIPEGVVSIESRAFAACDRLESVTLPNSLRSLGSSAFVICEKLEDVSIPGGVTTIGNEAFRQCHGLTRVTISEGVAAIGDMAFTWCNNLRGLTLPGSLLSIGQDAFYHCDGLASLTIPNRVTSIGKQAFSDCLGLTSLAIPGSVASIGQDAFYGCTGITSLSLSEGLESIGGFAFEHCSGLASVAIPSSVTSIGNGAFDHCDSLANARLDPPSPPQTGTPMFTNCASLTAIYVPAQSAEAYKTAAGWSTYSAIIYPQ